MLNKRILTLVFVVAFLTLIGCLPAPPNQAPVITSTPVTTAEVGVPYTYNVDATDPDVGDTLTYTLDIKPTNMSISSTTGLINWVPATEGDFSVVVKVSDGDLDITQSFNITVIEEEPSPTPTKYYTITVTAGDGGSISPSGAVTVNKGSNKTFTITPDAPFSRIVDVLVDGGSEGAVGTYTFTNVTADHTIEATFVLIGPVYNQTKDTHHDTIQEAINVADSDNTILVMAETYNLASPIHVNQSLTIKGDTTKGSSVIINAPTTGDDKDCFQIVADGVTIQGFRIQGAKDVKSPHNWNSGIAIGNYSIPGIQNTTISDNEITDCSYGIYVYRAQYVTISNNEIWGCTADSEGYWNGKGIHVYGEGSGTQCYSIDILNNEIYDNELFGIELNVWIIGEWIDADVLIDGNTIYNNGGPLYWDGMEALEMHRGISANDYIQGVTITNNEIFNHLPPTGSSFYGGSGIGIRAYGVRDWTINSNDIHDNVRGIYVYGGSGTDPDSTDVVMNHNDVYENVQGITVGDGNIGYANDNNIYDNNVTTYTGDGISPDGIVNLTGTVVFDATDNWWGNGGTDVNAGKPGEDGNNGVSANVGYVPWSTSQY